MSLVWHRDYAPGSKEFKRLNELSEAENKAFWLRQRQKQEGIVDGRPAEQKAKEVPVHGDDIRTCESG